MKKIVKVLFILMLNFVFGQNYKVVFSHIPIGQGITTSDSTQIVNSIGGVVSRDISSDSFKIGAGFLNTANSVLSVPPVITDFNFPTNIDKDGNHIIVSATIYDANGINTSNLHLQIGGEGTEVILPMLNISNSGYEATIDDSLISLKNFRAQIISTDNMGQESSTEYKTPDIKFYNSELSMTNEHSHYPEGVDKDIWRLVSWPSKPENNILALSSLEEGHVFYSWDVKKENYFNPDVIEEGRAYWFRHSYKEPVIFQEDTSVSIPLENHIIDLEKGWNLIGNPFSFPVQFQKDSIVNYPITYGLPNMPSGWSGPQYELIPWNGYAIFSPEKSSITVLPFSVIDSVQMIQNVMNEWYLNMKIQSESFINFSAEIGRRKNANDSYDIYDTPIYPLIDEHMSLVADLNGTDSFKYIRDIRSIDELNGVWNLRLDGKNTNEVISLSLEKKGQTPGNIVFGLVDIAKRKAYFEILEKTISIIKNTDSSYDLKLIAGDQIYVDLMSKEILSNIPEDFVLEQNYPNPFNPITNMNYALPQRSQIIISVYNVLGQEVKNLINEVKDYGYHSISWNGTDENGKEMASGVYFVRMISKGFIQSNKMLLLK